MGEILSRSVDYQVIVDNPIHEHTMYMDGYSAISVLLYNKTLKLVDTASFVVF